MSAARYVAQYAPDIYEVLHGGARVGSVQKYGRGEWVAYPVFGMSREFATRREAGGWVLREWARTTAPRHCIVCGDPAGVRCCEFGRDS